MDGLVAPNNWLELTKTAVLRLKLVDNYYSYSPFLVLCCGFGTSAKTLGSEQK